MISHSPKSSPEENMSPKEIVSEKSFIQSLNSQETQTKLNGNNDYQPNDDDINMISTVQVSTNCKGDYSVNASSTTSNISQCNNKHNVSPLLNKDHNQKQFLNKKTKRQSSQQIKTEKKPETIEIISHSDKLINSNDIKNQSDHQCDQKNKGNDKQQQKHQIKYQSINYNHTYSERDYLEKIKRIECNDRHRFMKQYFPSMYNPYNFYKNIKCIEQRRATHKEIFINKEELVGCQRDFFLNDFQTKAKDSKLPRKVWSVPKGQFDYEEFYCKCREIWPFSQCHFIKEFALEYLMNMNYNMDICLKNLNAFVLFVKQKIIENNIPIIKPDAKCVKNYNLRKTKKIVYR